MPRVLVAVVVAAVCAGACTAALEGDGRRAQPLTHAEPDDADAAVVALVREGAVVCTGTLVSPTVVLTAAHCLVGEARLPDIAFGDGLDLSRPVAVEAGLAHPDYDPDGFVADLAWLALAAPSSVPPALLGGSDEAPTRGAELRLVGFGSSGPADPGPPRKRQGLTRVTDRRKTSFNVAPEPSQPCAGDSGGPAFRTVDGVEYLVGVTSAGDARCEVYARETRVDAFDSFVAPVVTLGARRLELRGGCSLSSASDRAEAWTAVVLVLLLRRRRRRGRAAC